MRGAGKNSKITCHAIPFGVTSLLHDKKKKKEAQTRTFGIKVSTRAKPTFFLAGA